MISLDDYRNPHGEFHRYFSLDTETGAVQSKSFRHRMDDHVYQNCGWGALYRQSKTAREEAFAAVYVRERSLKLWLNNEEVTLRRGMSALSLPDFPFIHRFKLTIEETPIADIRYWRFFDIDDFPPEDIFEKIAEIVNSANSQKYYSYIWSATSVGAKRYIPPEGVREADIELIQDPFDPRDVWIERGN